MEGLPKAFIVHASIVADETSSVDIAWQPDSRPIRLICAESAWREPNPPGLSGGKEEGWIVLGGLNQWFGDESNACRR